jgi:dephospho-CoA kinase
MPNLETRPSNESRIVLGITGPIGAGKTSTGCFLEKDYGFKYLRYSQVLSEWKLEDPNAKDRLQTIGWEIMGGGLQKELNSRLISKIEPNCNYAIDGLRHLIDYESLRHEFGSHFELLFIDSPQELRWQRKKTKPRFSSYQEFQASDSHPVEQHINDLRRYAAVVIDNTGSIEELYSKLRLFLSGLIPGE